MQDRKRIAPIALLVSVVSAIVVVAFRGSWSAARDAALACHFDKTSADLYPFAVDGLIVVAIIALVLLRHDAGARRYCLGIIGGYTMASWIINFLHGLGWFAVDSAGATGARPVQPWLVVAVVASLSIGSIFLGSHLLVYAWRHLRPEQDEAAPESEGGAEVARPLTLPEALARVLDDPNMSQRKIAEALGANRKKLGAILGPDAPPDDEVAQIHPELDQKTA